MPQDLQSIAGPRETGFYLAFTKFDPDESGAIYAMDVFATVITAGTLIVQFLSSCAAYSSQAESLKVSFDWDLRALRKIQEYFEQRKAQSPDQQLSPDDAALLEQTAEYLNDLVTKAQRSLRKIRGKNFLEAAVIRVTWFTRRSELVELEAEIYSWTRRFDVRVLALPPEFQTVIHPAAGLGPPAPAVVKSNFRLWEFLQLALQEKDVRAKHMLLQDPSELETKITGRPDISFLPLQNGAEQIIFSSRRVSQKTVSDKVAFKNLESDMGVLAAALNCVEPAANIQLLKVEYYFYHAESRQFLFAHIPPYRTVSIMTLEKLISMDPYPETEAPLDQRLKLAQKLAEAVLFLHAAGFLHKNITSSSVVALHRWDEPAEVSSSFDDAYLMGFDLIRGAEAKTTKEGAVKEADETLRPIWEFDIYQHPDRQQGEGSPKYSKAYDVYSLGVVLLEIGLWQPLSRVAKGLDGGNPSGWATQLSDLAVPNLSPRIGEGYRRLVLWCLSLSSDDGMKEADFVEYVLDPLENMTNAMS